MDHGVWWICSLGGVREAAVRMLQTNLNPFHHVSRPAPGRTRASAAQSGSARRYATPSPPPWIHAICEEIVTRISPGACRCEAGGRQTLKGVNVGGIPPRQGRESGGTRLQAPLGVHQFNTTLCPAVTVVGCMLLPSLTEYFPAGKETGWLTCLDASCVPEASSTA